MIVWAGISSDLYNVVVERFPNQPGPSRRYEVIPVQGRNGDLLIDGNAYDNYIQSYDIYFNAEKNKTPAGARAVRQWLQQPIGYQKLEDSYDPQFFRMAYYSGPTDIENVMNLFGRATLSFTCKPQRWRKEGQFSTLYSFPTKLYNEWFPALPLIKVNGTGAGNLYVGSYTVNVLSLDEYVYLDSETQNAYKDTLNKNNTIYAPDFPILQPGETLISWDGEIESVEVTPRWWTV